MTDSTPLQRILNYKLNMDIILKLNVQVFTHSLTYTLNHILIHLHAAPPPTTSAFTPAQYSAYSNDTSARARYVVYDPNRETLPKNNGYQQQQQSSNYFPQTSFFSSHTLPTATVPSNNYVYQAPPLPHNMNTAVASVQHQAAPPGSLTHSPTHLLTSLLTHSFTSVPKTICQSCPTHECTNAASKRSSI